MNPSYCPTLVFVRYSREVVHTFVLDRKKVVVVVVLLSILVELVKPFLAAVRACDGCIVFMAEWTIGGLALAFGFATLAACWLLLVTFQLATTTGETACASSCLGGSRRRCCRHGHRLYSSAGCVARGRLCEGR